MIILKQGNLLNDEAEALVNTVNCVGVMGKGIALQFKQAYPKMFTEYQKACRQEEMQPGKMHVVDTKSLFNPKFIINFPTKRHWKSRSRKEDIESGLVDLVKVVKDLGLKSIALPPLGCGNGGLKWSEIRPKIEKAFEQIPDVEVHLYEPAGSPKPDQIKIKTNPPKMTRARALFLMLMNDYSIPGYKLSLLEIQKLAYFLQNVGEPLRLRFEKGKFGPYADNLNHVLQRIDGHFIRGFGDRSRDAEIYLMRNAAEKAETFLKDDESASKHLEAVRKIIHGFETPYGLELLATVHWVAANKPEIQDDIQKIIGEVHSWNERKKKIFKEKHIGKAWEHLEENKF
ncbi:macro domain-containing protein [Lentibacillus cibarius]|uniref:Macro domain-containing protein n=1 Tax=Lentibacillus cibarius TaxID=2583219 RepID=A0A549YEK0_9BACI|nr:macro domain-containing protein [Lentibacillus cibarius]TMN21416.1 macro domain-containing protein [Lentibacillus cibarius]TRM10292.1 macro domain-containing protein [Lentibacillus cibarius]